MKKVMFGRYTASAIALMAAQLSFVSASHRVEDVDRGQNVGRFQRDYGGELRSLLGEKFFSGEELLGASNAGFRMNPERALPEGWKLWDGTSLLTSSHARGANPKFRITQPEDGTLKIEGDRYNEVFRE